MPHDWAVQFPDSIAEGLHACVTYVVSPLVLPFPPSSAFRGKLHKRGHHLHGPWYDLVKISLALDAVLFHDRLP